MPYSRGCRTQQRSALSRSPATVERRNGLGGNVLFQSKDEWTGRAKSLSDREGRRTAYRARLPRSIETVEGRAIRCLDGMLPCKDGRTGGPQPVFSAKTRRAA